VFQIVKVKSVVLGGVMVSILAIGVQGSQVQTQPRAVKIHCMPCFGGEVNPSAPCCKILLHVENPFEV
jgi:hypothetical protein